MTRVKYKTNFFNHVPRVTPTLVCNPKMKCWYGITIVRNLYCVYHVQCLLCISCASNCIMGIMFTPLNNFMMLLHDILLLQA